MFVAFHTREKKVVPVFDNMDWIRSNKSTGVVNKAENKANVVYYVSCNARWVRISQLGQLRTLDVTLDVTPVFVRWWGG